jgi:signal transduction histidine kinase/FixJ family two-component response regulator
MFKSLRYRLLIWFVLSTVLIAILSFTFFQIYKSTKINQQEAQENLNFFRNQFLKDQTHVANFLATETHNEKFFITGESEHLTAHYAHSSRIDSCYVNCLSKNATKNILEKNQVVAIRNYYTKYCILLDSLVYKIYQRGYKNLGLEGELASYLYRIKEFNIIPSADLTNLKLAEREYINRPDTTYIHQVNNICNALITNILHSNRYSTTEKELVIKALKKYKHTFNEIVTLDKKIGIEGSNGLMQELSQISNNLEKKVSYSILSAQNTYETNMSHINLLFSLIAILLVAIALAISVYTSQYLVKNLEQLTSYINSLAKNNFNHYSKFDLKHSTKEIKQIYVEFRNMLADLRIREKQRDKALKIAEDNKQRYQELADLLPQCIYETDRMGNLTYVNKAWHETFRYTVSDVNRGINLLEIISTDPTSSLFGFSKVENNDFIAIKKDGTKFASTVYSDVIKKGARIIGRRGIIIDSTLRNKYIESLKKETHRAITSDKHKSSFLANMSHEIRTPMNSIIGFTNMLSSQDIPDDLKSDFINHIQTSSEMLLNLIDDIIDVAKIEDGQLTIKKSDCRPAEVIESLAANFEAYKNKVEKEHLKLKISIPDRSIYVRTDAFRLKQIISNLMSNAIKFTEKGWIEVGMHVKNQRMLEFYVEDTGMGMNKEDLRTIFNRFTRSKLSEEKKISGTGLGLAISKNLVEMLDGSMWVSSEPNKGTRFTFELPYVRVMNIPQKEVEAPKTSYNWQNKKFLVAEDDDNSYAYICHILKNTGVEIIHAKNGKEAIDALSFHENIDLVLMDLQMPVLNGLETTKEIKKLYPNLIVIAQTAFAMEGDRNKCISAGCDDYITKPLHAESLLAKIDQFIDYSLPTTTEESASPKISAKSNSAKDITQK